MDSRVPAGYDPEIDWGREPWRAPALQVGDVQVFDEPGRIIGRVDYRSHYLRVVKAGGQHWLLVRHGAGVERHGLGVQSGILVQALERLPPDERYIVLYAFFDLPSKARRQGDASASDRYTRAFVEGRLKKRKARHQDTAKVWIEHPLTTPPKIQCTES